MKTKKKRLLAGKKPQATGGRGARKTPVHSVHTARVTVANSAMFDMDALDCGYEPTTEGAAMARVVDRLTEAKIRTLDVGLHADGRGLYLQVRPGARS